MTTPSHAQIVRIEKLLEDALRVQGFRPRGASDLYVGSNRLGPDVNLTLLAAELAEAFPIDARSA